MSVSVSQSKNTRMKIQTTTCFGDSEPRVLIFTPHQKAIRRSALGIGEGCSISTPDCFAWYNLGVQSLPVLESRPPSTPGALLLHEMGILWVWGTSEWCALLSGLCFSRWSRQRVTQAISCYSYSSP